MNHPIARERELVVEKIYVVHIGYMKVIYLNINSVRKKHVLIDPMSFEQVKGTIWEGCLAMV